MTQPESRGSTTNTNIIVAIIAATAAIYVPKLTPPPLNHGCLELLQEYVAAVQKCPADRERIMSGKNGKSTLLLDPQAKYCNIRPEDIE